MERVSIQERYDEAVVHVAEGAARIKRQRELHAELVRDGHVQGAAEAFSLLSRFEEIQSMFVADCDRYKKELADAKSPMGQQVPKVG